MNKHKAMKIHNRICKNIKKLFVTVNPRNVCKMEFSDHLWLPFLDQPQYDVVVFAITYFDIYKNILTECKHAISTNDILTFNKTLETSPTDILEWTNIYESSYEDSIVNYFTWKI